MTNLPKYTGGDGKFSRRISEVRVKSDRIQPQTVPDMLVTTTTRGSFLTPKRKVRQAQSGGGSTGARWL